MKVKNVQLTITGTVSDEVRTASQDLVDELMMRIYDIEYATVEAAYDHMSGILDILLEQTLGAQNRKVIDENILFVPVF